MGKFPTFKPLVAVPSHKVIRNYLQAKGKAFTYLIVTLNFPQNCGLNSSDSSNQSEWMAVSRRNKYFAHVCLDLREVLQCSVREYSILDLLLPRVSHEEGEFVGFCRLCLFRRSRAFVRILQVMQISFLRLSEIGWPGKNQMRMLFESSHGRYLRSAISDEESPRSKQSQVSKDDDDNFSLPLA